MSGLVLKLAPNERVLINGAVIENGDRRSKIAIKTPNVNVLRLKDAIHPDQAKTPVSRACYIAQLMLSGDVDPGRAKGQLIFAIEQLSQVFDDRDSRNLLADATGHVVNGAPYQALRSLRELLPRESRLFAARPQ
ncbi:flagellar biosynthesis repressor FlbT [Paracoccus sp. (in: a-proteobacteria)]|uniref:flagellar biosynthesis repressor FlbT n=1 Tax=Paracoccus sp. TaxID=267 RepID=UPI0026E0A8C6|nr:flagellar biosynthesis repressor FlbT [Paracoccus sp. (in: a-proteobacteria)]MDO5647420.1 flagellar biosynthesis repressor FlbT [Paracoccus sp. (in: a-proteobacteria)]